MTSPGEGRRSWTRDRLHHVGGLNGCQLSEDSSLETGVHGSNVWDDKGRGPVWYKLDMPSQPAWHRGPLPQCLSCCLHIWRTGLRGSLTLHNLARAGTRERGSGISSKALPHRHLSATTSTGFPRPSEAALATLGFVRCCSLLSSRSLWSLSNSSLISAGVLFLSTTCEQN